MTRSARRRFTDDFKQEAVRLTLTSGRTIKQVADDLVIGLATLTRWRIRALDMAVALRQPPKGCIHHTDRGSQYCSHDYQKRLKKHGFEISMSGKGNCFDNAVVETFFKTLKAELIWRSIWQTRRQTEAALFEYINGFYNPRRRHSTLGGKSPLAFETVAV